MLFSLADDRVSVLAMEVLTLDIEPCLPGEDVSHFHTMATSNIELWKAVKKTMSCFKGLNCLTHFKLRKGHFQVR